MHDISANLHGMGDIDRLIAGQILHQNPFSSHFSVEDHIKAVEVPEDTEGSRRVRYRQRHIASRHVPGLSDTGSLLRGNGDRTIRKTRRKDKGLIALCLHHRECHVSGDPGRRSLAHGRSHKFLLPGLRWFKIPAVDKNFLVNRYLSQPGRKRWSNTLPAERPDNLVEALLGLSGSVKEEIRVFSGPHARERGAHDHHSASHHRSYINLVFQIEHPL